MRESWDIIWNQEFTFLYMNFEILFDISVELSGSHLDVRE